MSVLGERAVERLRVLLREPGSDDVLDDRFELGDPIGEGAMGVVYAAWDRTAEREVAIKILRAQDEHAARRFAREVAALGELTHPAVVHYVAHGVHGGAPYFATDRLVGCTLAERLTRGPLSVAETIALGARITDGLAAVHRAGIAHRDVKPSNIFLVEEAASDARLLDFGLARPQKGPAVTEVGALVGTPGYMAPEQVRGDPSTGPRADVFALGCVLFECVTGRAPFRGATTETLLAQILLEAPPPLRELRSDVPAALEGLLGRMMEKDASSRPDAEDVTRQLAALQAGLPATPAETDGQREPAPGLAEGAIVAGKYTVGRRIGEGGMGIVVAARHLELGTRVALKLLRRETGADEARFLREARAVARIESEHVARVLDFGRTADGTPYIVMEHLSGVDLGRRLIEHGPLAIGTAVGYVLDACEAIAEAHSLGIVHRDIKPSNLFLVSRRNRTELVKVLDFGISKVTASVAESTVRSADGRHLDTASIGSDTTTTRSNVMGSLWYMAPEQLHDPQRVDARADIWALGIVLHELIAGSRPFETTGAGASPTRLREVVEDAPAELESVILRCLEKDPERRFPDVAALTAALAPFAAPGAEEPPRSDARASQARQRFRLALPVASLVAALAIGAALLRTFDRPPRADAPAPSISQDTARIIPAPPPPDATESRPTSPAPSSALAPLPSTTAPPVTVRPPTVRRASTASPSSSLPPRAKPPALVDLRDPAMEER